MEAASREYLDVAYESRLERHVDDYGLTAEYHKRRDELQALASVKLIQAAFTPELV